MRDQNTPDPPLKPVVFQILLVLLDGERHGYGIVREVEDRSNGAIRVEPANLYRTLRTLLARGLIEESAKRPDPDLDDERRRYFRITNAGVRAARVEADRLQHLVLAARAHDLLTR
jgi:DNA-binding PadR family transcriptional regulator